MAVLAILSELCPALIKSVERKTGLVLFSEEKRRQSKIQIKHAQRRKRKERKEREREGERERERERNDSQVSAWRMQYE